MKNGELEGGALEDGESGVRTSEDEERKVTLEDQLRQFAPNFIDSTGQLYLVRCMRCTNENYAPAVGTGVCVWCGWKVEDGETGDEKG
jgi:hypothetical protein